MMTKYNSLEVSRSNPFSQFICTTCGKEMGSHYIFRPDNFADTNNRVVATNGRFFCHRDGTSYSGDRYQRKLERNF